MGEEEKIFSQFIYIEFAYPQQTLINVINKIMIVYLKIILKFY